MDLEVVVEALRYLIFLFSQSLPLTYFFIFNPSDSIVNCKNDI